MRRPKINLPTRKQDGAELDISYPRELVRAALNLKGERRAVGRQFAFDVLGRFTPVVAVDRGGIRYLLNTADKVISRKTFGWGNFEQDIMEEGLKLLEAAFGRSCVEGRHFVDVGANIGVTTIPAVKLFGAARAHAFEPDPANYALLQGNVAANGLEAEVAASRVAVSDVPGVALLELSGLNSGDHRVRSLSASDQGAFGEATRTTIEIPVTTLDVYLHENKLPPQDVGVVWIDVQGHEGHVLAGASALVGAGTPVICEYWPYGLRRAGGLSMFHDLVAGEYGRIIDVRQSSHGRIIERPAKSVLDLAAVYDGPDTHTDLILMK